MRDSEGERLGFLLCSTETPAATSQGQYRRFPVSRSGPSSSAAPDSTPDTQLKYGPHSSRKHPVYTVFRHPLQLITRAHQFLSSWLSSTPRQQQQLLPSHRSPVFLSMAPAQHMPAGNFPPSGHAAAGPVLTVRAVAAGLLVGAVLCFSNTYFGLQTGWVTMGSLQSAILGYGLFQGLAAAGLLSRHLNAAENVIVQTTAVATATMPLAAGLVGIIPALGLLTPDEHPGGPVKLSPWQLLAWCSALAFFGVFVAVPLRYQTIIREKLRFPSGTATASVIRTLHGLPPQQEEGGEGGDSVHNVSGGNSGNGSGGVGSWDSDAVGNGSAVMAEPWGNKQRQSGEMGLLQQDNSASRANGSSSSANSNSKGAWTASQVDLEVAVWAECEQEHATLLGRQAGQAAAGSSGMLRQQQQQQQWGRALRLLLWSFAISGAYSLAAAWIKPLKVLKVFDWVGLPSATAWGWVLQPSAGYIGQGMIMGPKTAWSMMAGAITGWAVLGPLAKAKGWAPGPIKDVQTGAAGWLMWLGLALLLGDCFSELALLIANTACDKAVQHGWLSAVQSSSSTTASSTDRSGWFGRVRDKSPFGWGSGSGYAELRPDTVPGLGQQQQRSSGLRSRASSKSAIAGSSLELSPNNSTGNVAEVGAAAGSNSSSLEQQQGNAADGSLVVPLTAGPLAGSHVLLQQQQQMGAGLGHLQAPFPKQLPAAAAAAAAAASPYAADDRAPDAQVWLLTAGFWVPGLLLSTALATAVLSPMLGMPFYEPLVAVIVALLVALVAVRALGQTDLNPVSGVGKISQLVFAVVSPGAVLPNLVAGAIAEAGAQQAGDLMQDFKTAHLLGVAPSSQLVAMLLGSAASVPLSVAAYMLYTSAWQVPGPELPAPTAQIWLDMAKLVNGGHLPDHIGPFCVAAAAIAAALPVLHLVMKKLQKSASAQNSSSSRRAQAHVQQGADVDGHSGFGLSSTGSGGLLQQAASRPWFFGRKRSAVDWVLALLPSGVGFAVGCYLTPNWTVPRVIGSVFEQTWLLLSPQTHAAFMLVTASGLVLGEGCASVVTAVVQAIVR